MPILSIDYVHKYVCMYIQPSPVTPPPITGISEEEAEELRLTISELKEELTTTRVNLGRVETNNAKLSESALSSNTNVPRTVACSELYLQMSVHFASHRPAGEGACEGC